MQIRDIKELIKIFSEHDIVELSYESEQGLKLTLRKNGAFVSNSIGSVAPIAIQGQDTALMTKGAVEPEVQTNQSQSPNEEEDQDRFVEINAPMVGTFYRAPAPDADPYVKVGERVEVGQTMCIIEAMKLMNEIESEIAGTIVKIYVENGQPVEYGQPLFLIEKE
jgi:oxaloacetate decarboxylase alpha subunit